MLFVDPQPGHWLASQAQARFDGETDGAWAGLGVALGDLAGVGWGQVIVGGPLEPDGGDAGGVVQVVGPRP